MITFPAPCYPSNFQAITDLFSFPVQLEKWKRGGGKGREVQYVLFF